MTTKERFIKMLVDSGMFENQAEEVMELAIPKIEEMTPDYKYSWDKPASDYPDTVYSVIWLTVKMVALEWIDENIPQAWYRPMFV